MDNETLAFSAITEGVIAILLGLVAIFTGMPFIAGMACGVGVLALIDGLFAWL